MSAKGNGGTYHYYACSGRQKLGPEGCDGERIPRDTLETAVVRQFASLYRDGALIEDALAAAAERERAGRPALEEQRHALAEEIHRAERALGRYYTAFETGDLDAKRFQTRFDSLETRLGDLREQDLALAARLTPQAPPAPDGAALAAVADRLDDVIRAADPKQAKALLRLLIKDLRVSSRREILPSYRVVTDAVCALPSSVGAPGIEPGTSRV
jgi:site-specific DNA recombinase